MFPKQAVPPNVKFEVLSITALPADWSNMFDLVNQRLLIAGLKAKEWPVALSEYMRVLKPGGHIQLVEVVPRTLAISGPAGKAVVSLFVRACEAKGLLADCAELLPLMLKRAGFVNIRAEIKLIPVGEVLGPDGKDSKPVVSNAYRCQKDSFVRSGVVETTEAVDKVMDEMEQEWEDMGGFYYANVIVVAEKPQSDPKPA